MNIDESYRSTQLTHQEVFSGAGWATLSIPRPGWLVRTERERAIGRKRERDLCGKAPAATPTIHVLSLKVGVGGGGGRWQLYCAVKACREDV